MNTEKLLADLNRKFPVSEFTKFANVGDWASAANSAARYGMWGAWSQCAEAAGLPSDDAARDVKISELIAAKRAKYSR